jgi:hypothetical protein
MMRFSSALLAFFLGAAGTQSQGFEDEFLNLLPGDYSEVTSSCEERDLLSIECQISLMNDFLDGAGARSVDGTLICRTSADPNTDSPNTENCFSCDIEVDGKMCDSCSLCPEGNTATAFAIDCSKEFPSSFPAAGVTCSGDLIAGDKYGIVAPTTPDGGNSAAAAGNGFVMALSVLSLAVIAALA